MRQSAQIMLCASRLESCVEKLVRIASRQSGLFMSSVAGCILLCALRAACALVEHVAHRSISSTASYLARRLRPMKRGRLQSQLQANLSGLRNRRRLQRYYYFMQNRLRYRGSNPTK